MAPEITGIPQFKFQELISHTFPGFFFAFSIFMLIDVWSPLNITQWAFSTVSTFLGAIGFIVLTGTIFGVFIDWTHHWLLEEKLFASQEGYKEIENEIKNIFPEVEKRRVAYHYFFKTIGKDTWEYLSDNYYRYSEFYGNIFVSLIPFSFIFPYYLSSVLKISWGLSLWLGVILFFAAWLSLYSSYGSYLTYLKRRLDVLYGYLDYGSFRGIEVVVEDIPKAIVTCQKIYVKITTQLKDKDWQDFKKQGVKIHFETSSGTIIETLPKTDINGKAEAILWCFPAGKAIITARVGPVSGSAVIKF